MSIISDHKISKMKIMGDRLWEMQTLSNKIQTITYGDEQLLELQKLIKRFNEDFDTQLNDTIPQNMIEDVGIMIDANSNTYKKAKKERRDNIRFWSDLIVRFVLGSSAIAVPVVIYFLGGSSC